MIGCGIPIFYPTSVQQILDFGVHAIAVSRFSGLWTSMKLVSEIVETSASVHVDLDRVTLLYQKMLISQRVALTFVGQIMASNKKNVFINIAYQLFWPMPVRIKSIP